MLLISIALWLHWGVNLIRRLHWCLIGVSNLVRRLHWCLVGVSKIGIKKITLMLGCCLKAYRSTLVLHRKWKDLNSQINNFSMNLGHTLKIKEVFLHYCVVFLDPPSHC